MMIIETWVAAVLVIGICVIALAIDVALMLEQQSHKETRKELKRVMEENSDLKAYIEKQRAKHIFDMTTKFCEGKKK